jgi:hypothetical protein
LGNKNVEWDDAGYFNTCIQILHNFFKHWSASDGKSYGLVVVLRRLISSQLTEIEYPFLVLLAQKSRKEGTSGGENKPVNRTSDM